MTLEEIEFELEMAGLSREQQIKLLSAVQRDGYNAQVLDQKLRLMGFPPIFEMYEEDDEND